jgi:hypothetical protein
VLSFGPTTAAGQAVLNGQTSKSTSTARKKTTNSMIEGRIKQMVTTTIRVTTITRLCEDFVLIE